MKYAYPKVVVDLGTSYGAFIGERYIENVKRELKDGEICRIEILDDNFNSPIIKWKK